MSKLKGINTKCVKTRQEPGGFQHNSKRGTHDGPTFQTRKSEMLHHELLPPAVCLESHDFPALIKGSVHSLSLHSPAGGAQTSILTKTKSDRRVSTSALCSERIKVNIKSLHRYFHQKAANTDEPDGEELNIWCVRVHNQKVITVVLQ